MPRVASISHLVPSLNLPSMETQTRSLGPTQPVPSFVSSKSARSQTLSRSDVCAKFVTTTADGRTEALTLSIGKPITIGRNPSLWLLDASSVLGCLVYSLAHMQLVRDTRYRGIQPTLQDTRGSVQHRRNHCIVPGLVNKRTHFEWAQNPQNICHCHEWRYIQNTSLADIPVHT